MTDGIILAESQTDKQFRQYDTIIIDEAHERSLNIDFLLGMMKRILPQRRDLKLIITSATIDAKRFADHFTERNINGGKKVPVIEVSGRTYPIEILYRSLEDFDDEDDVSRETRRGSGEDYSNVSRGTDPEERALLAAVDELAEMGRGDMLIFMPTERDIFETAKLLRHHSIPGDDKARKTEILPLYARLPVAEQQKVFKTSSHRRIVIATNVAESSLTVPGIRYVIDTGTARISRYSARTRTQRLPIEAVSQASADQRAGRCGRIGSGVCIRLFSEQDYRTRDRYTTPEIQRTNLASVILQTKSLKLGDIERFPFIDPPRIAAIQDGYKTLFEIGAIDRKNGLTDIGWKLSRLPVDPRIGRMILAAEQNGCLREMLIIASVLEIQDPRERPLDHQAKADAVHEKFLDDRSDFLGYLKLWDFYQNLKEQTSRSGLRKATLQNFLSFNRMKEWNDIHVQLQEFVRDAKMKVGQRKDDYDSLHRSILTGMLSGIANRDERSEYTVCGGGKFLLWPGSGVAKRRHPRAGGDLDNTLPKPIAQHKKSNTEAVQTDSVPSSLGPRLRGDDGEKKKEGLPRWIVSGERVETTRKFLRTVAQIDAAWIEPLAEHLINRVYLEPHWNPETGYVHAYEKVSLFGLVLVPKRRINYGPINPKEARNIFIQRALVEEELDTKLDFFEYNQLLVDEARKLGDKLRRPDIVRGELARYDFYQARIPDDVYDKRSLEKWYQQEKNRECSASQSPDHRGVPAKLFMGLADLLTERVDDSVLENFPDSLKTFDGGSAQLEYNFAPGEEHDGLTVVVPMEGLRQLEPSRLGWLVPGLVEQKIAALLKSLPKEIRRQIVPIPETVKELVKKIEFGQGSLEEQIAKEVSRLIGRLVVPKDFNAEQLPPELRMGIKVLDPEGNAVGQSKNLDDLRKEFGVKGTPVVADPRWSRTELTVWDFGDLPESIEIERNGVRIKAFPMIVGNQLALADSLDKAVRETRRGIVRLFYLQTKRDIRSQVQWLPNADRLKVFSQPLPEFDFQHDVGMLIASRAFQIDELPIPRTQAEFERRSQKGKERLGVAVQEIAKFVGPLFEAFHQARLSIEQNKSQRTDWAWRDAKESLQRLVEPGFPLDVPWSMLKEFPRFFKAIPLRFEKLKGGETADRQATDELAVFWKKYSERLELHQAAGITDPELDAFRWMIEEYRVSLFAQRLGTALKVSPQRLDKQLEKVRR